MIIAGCSVFALSNIWAINVQSKIHPKSLKVWAALNQHFNQGIPLLINYIQSMWINVLMYIARSTTEYNWVPTQNTF